MTEPFEVEDPKTRPRRVMELSGGWLRGVARIVWERKYGVWFWISVDPILRGQRIDHWGDTEIAVRRFAKANGFTVTWT